MFATMTKDVAEGQPRSAIINFEWDSAVPIVAAYLEARANTSEFCAKEHAPEESQAHEDNAHFYRMDIKKLAEGDRSPVAMWLGAAVTWAIASAESDGADTLRKFQCP